MGDKLSKPVTEKHNEQGTGNGLRYGIASMQGWRTHQEDAHCAKIQVDKKLEDWSFFAVFDGHDGDLKGNGAKVSAYCAEHLLESILSTEESADFTDRIRTGFLNLDQSMRTVPGVGDVDAGTAVVGVFVTPEQIYFVNCGDCRAVLCKAGEPSFGTEDHKPNKQKEYERIKSAGGYVNSDRVNGELAMSRCLGDYKYKKDENRGQCEQLVSPEPEVSIIARDEKDEFLVIACDGIWDEMKNEKICKFIRSRLLVTDDLVTIANEVLDTCLQKSSEDNMSIVLVTFPGAPTPSPEAIEKERNLERDIESLIIKLISIPSMVRTVSKEDEGVSVPNLIYTLNDMAKRLPDLPPEGNIGTKRGFIEKILQRCQDRANKLRILVDEAVDVLHQKNGDGNRTLIELMMDKRRENSSRLPSSDNIDTT